MLVLLLQRLHRHSNLLRWITLHLQLEFICVVHFFALLISFTWLECRIQCSVSVCWISQQVFRCQKYFLLLWDLKFCGVMTISPHPTRTHAHGRARIHARTHTHTCLAIQVGQTVFASTHTTLILTGSGLNKLKVLCTMQYCSNKYSSKYCSNYMSPSQCMYVGSIKAS